MKPFPKKLLLMAKTAAIGPSDHWKDWITHFNGQKARYNKFKKHFNTGKQLVMAERLLSRKVSEGLNAEWSPMQQLFPSVKQLVRSIPKAWNRRKK